MLVPHSQGKVKHYVFVSSAGAYKANSVEPIHMEGDERKASAGHVKVKIESRISSCTCASARYIRLYGKFVI